MTQNPDMQGLYPKLMDHYGTHVQRKDLGGVRRLMHGLGDPDPSIFAIRSFTEEPFDNEWSNVYNTREYDATQPYGWDFGEDLAARSSESALAGTEPPNWSSVGQFGDVMQNGERLAQPDDEGFLGDAVNALAPIVQTAGSYALPILFSMLMRGGK